MATPLVSVILPTFNRLEYLRPAVDSVRAQTFADWELIIADDGSDAHTRAYLKTLESPPEVRVIWLGHTGNYSAVRNAALRDASGKYVAFIDSDDLWEPRKLELQVRALRSDATRRWNYSGYRCIDASNNEIALPGLPEWVPHCGAISEEILRGTAVVCTPAVVAERDLVMRAGGFDEGQALFEDFDLWLRLLVLSEVGIVDEPLVRVRKHEQNTCGTGAAMLAGRDRVLRKLAALIGDRRLQRTVAELRATSAVHLASAYAETARVAAAQTLLRSCRYSWRYAGWWLGGSRVLLKALTPRRLLHLYRATRRQPSAGAQSRAFWDMSP